MSVIDPSGISGAQGFFFFGACGKSFVRSVPRHSMTELAWPGRRDLFGIIKTSRGRWKSAQPKVKGLQRRPSRVANVTFRLSTLHYRRQDNRLSS